jgi:DNA-binding transcriptional LysR family regulator
MEPIPAHVRTFREIVRQASFSRAAEALHPSQPAVSHHILHLEHALGARVLERIGRRALGRAAAG